MILSSLQFRPRFALSPADVKDNFRKCEELFHTASKMGSEFIVCPELFLTGYSFLDKDQAARVCERSDGPTFRTIRGVAQDLKAYISWGYVEFGSDGALYNAASLVDPNGILLTSYRKVNLFAQDFFWAKSGIASAPTVKTDFGYTSIIVCRDLRNKVPSMPRTAAEKDTPLFSSEKLDLVAASVNWGKGGFPPNTWMDFVADTGCTLIVADRWGKEKGTSEHGSLETNFGQGKSCIISKEWKIHIDGLKFDSDCLVTAVIDGRNK